MSEPLCCPICATPIERHDVGPCLDGWVCILSGWRWYAFGQHTAGVNYRFLAPPTTAAGWRRAGWAKGVIVDAVHPLPEPCADAFRSCPKYSQEIAPAWELVRRLRREGWIVRVQEMPDGWPWQGAALPEQERAMCLLHTNPDRWKRVGREREVGGVTEMGHTVPQAIVRAFLRAHIAEQQHE